MVAGKVKVRADTARSRTNVIPIQINGPEAGSGAGVLEGKVLRYGAKK